MIRSVKRLKLLNLNCREASRLVSEGLDRRLTLLERIGLRLHLVICAACRTWGRQVRLVRRALRYHLQHQRIIDAFETAEGEVAGLSDEARVRILKALERR